jgi:hypothetical protein
MSSLLSPPTPDKLVDILKLQQSHFACTLLPFSLNLPTVDVVLLSVSLNKVCKKMHT